MFVGKTIPELMDSIPQYFVADKSIGVDAKILFHLTGDQGGDWTVTIRDQTCKVNQGTEINPRLVFTADAQDCLDILMDKLDGLKAYMTGKLKLSGDIKLALKIASFFQFVP